MRLVIADTSPIRYLALIGQIELLHRLFESVTVPAEVAAELSDPSAPVVVRLWINSAPEWLKIMEVTPLGDSALDTLDPGERSAIALGMLLKADLILIDERRGSAVARQQGLRNYRDAGHFRPGSAARSNRSFRLRRAAKQTNFRYRQELIDQMLSKHQDRPQP